MFAVAVHALPSKQDNRPILFSTDWPALNKKEKTLPTPIWLLLGDLEGENQLIFKSNLYLSFQFHCWYFQLKLTVK